MPTCRTSGCSRRRIAASCSISTTSTRPHAGPVRVGRQAPRGERRGGRAQRSGSATSSAHEPPPRRRRATARRWPAPPRSIRSTCGTPASSSTRSGSSARPAARKGSDEADRRGEDGGRPQEPARCAGQADRGRRRTPPDPRPSTAHPTVRTGRRLESELHHVRAFFARLPRVVDRRPSPPAAAATRVTDLGRQGGRRGQRRHAVPRRACSSPATANRCSCN